MLGPWSSDMLTNRQHTAAYGVTRGSGILSAAAVCRSVRVSRNFILAVSCQPYAVTKSWLRFLPQKTIVETAKRLAEEDRAGQSIDQLKESERELTGLFGSLLDTMRPDGDSVEKADAERIRKVGALETASWMPPVPANAGTKKHAQSCKTSRAVFLHRYGFRRQCGHESTHPSMIMSRAVRLHCNSFRRQCEQDCSF